ncbi:MAG: hypothetical protein H0W64_01170 [Gammaproteobacteria bacterium]|nr:hypothetical protein [Gammaproteobacteria bacterium]
MSKTLQEEININLSPRKIASQHLTYPLSVKLWFTKKLTKEQQNWLRCFVLKNWELNPDADYFEYFKTNQEKLKVAQEKVGAMNDKQANWLGSVDLKQNPDFFEAIKNLMIQEWLEANTNKNRREVSRTLTEMLNRLSDMKKERERNAIPALDQELAEIEKQKKSLIESLKVPPKIVLSEEKDHDNTENCCNEIRAAIINHLKQLQDLTQVNVNLACEQIKSDQKEVQPLTPNDSLTQAYLAISEYQMQKADVELKTKIDNLLISIFTLQTLENSISNGYISNLFQKDLINYINFRKEQDGRSSGYLDYIYSMMGSAMRFHFFSTPTSFKNGDEATAAFEAAQRDPLLMEMIERYKLCNQTLQPLVPYLFREAKLKPPLQTVEQASETPGWINYLSRGYLG